MLHARKRFRSWLALLPLALTLLASGALVFSDGALADHKPGHEKGGKGKGGGNGGGDGDDGGGDGALAGTAYFSSTDEWAMNPDGSGKTLVIEGLAGSRPEPSYDLHFDHRWFATTETIDGEFYPIHVGELDPQFGAEAGDLADWGYTGDPAPDEAWRFHVGIQIDGEGDPDTFQWGITASDASFFDGRMFPIETGVPVTGDPQTLDLLGDGSALFTVELAETTGNTLDEGWVVQVDKQPRRELFAVSESGDSIQVSDDPTLEPLFWTRWAPEDAMISSSGQRWEITGVDEEGNEYGDVVEAGIYATPTNFDGGAPSAPMLVIDEQVVDMPGNRHHDVIGNHAWAPDGSALVYNINNPDEYDDQRLIVGDFVTGSNFTIATGASGFGGIDWSPTGEWIAFGSDAGIERIRPDGSDRELILKDRDRGFSFTYFTWPRFSPTGSHFVCEGTSDDGPLMIHSDVYRAEADGKKAVNLTDDFDSNASPLAWR